MGYNWLKSKVFQSQTAMGVVAVATVLLTITFGIGSWMGQNRGNQLAWNSMLFDKYGLCVDHEVGSEPVCWFGYFFFSFFSLFFPSEAGADH